LNISRVFVLYQSKPDGKMTDPGIQYGMLTLPGLAGLDDKLNDCHKNEDLNFFDKSKVI
jgi:hypothetical protein